MWFSSQRQVVALGFFSNACSVCHLAGFLCQGTDGIQSTFTASFPYRHVFAAVRQLAIYQYCSSCEENSGGRNGCLWHDWKKSISSGTFHLSPPPIRTGQRCSNLRSKVWTWIIEAFATNLAWGTTFKHLSGGTNKVGFDWLNPTCLAPFPQHVTDYLQKPSFGVEALAGSIQDAAPLADMAKGLRDASWQLAASWKVTTNLP